ncbi:MAG: TVP38/TMEM64 family protein [Filifactoraceae bacterium]
MKLINFVLFFVGACICYFIVRVYGISDKLMDIEGLKNYLEQLGMIGYVVFILMYIISAVFMLPASALAIVGGIAFGAVKGGFLSSIGATLGALAAFSISKYFARDFVNKKFGDSKFFKKIEYGVRENGSSFLILTRLVPFFPYVIQNYCYGLTAMKFFDYTAISFITMMPASFIYSYLSSEIIKEGVSVLLLIKFSVAGIILFCMSLIPKYIAKKNKIELEFYKDE